MDGAYIKIGGDLYEIYRGAPPDVQWAYFLFSDQRGVGWPYREDQSITAIMRGGQGGQGGQGVAATTGTRNGVPFNNQIVYCTGAPTAGMHVESFERVGDLVFAVIHASSGDEITASSRYSGSRTSKAPGDGNFDWPYPDGVRVNLALRGGQGGQGGQGVAGVNVSRANVPYSK